MPQGQRTIAIQRIRDLLRTQDRYVDIAARLRVWDPSPTGPIKAELLPRIYGGRWDTLLRRYVTPRPADLVIAELSCHRGQLPLLLFDSPGIARVMALGPPRGGKTRAAVIKALLLALEYPGKTIGLIAPTSDRRAIVLKTLNEVLASAGASHWQAGYSVVRKRYDLANTAVFDIVAAAKASAARGNPLQGRDWWRSVVDESQNVEDDSQAEIDARGGAAGTSYCVFETATNSPLIRERLELYQSAPDVHAVLKYDTKSNPWVSPEFYERLKKRYGDRLYREFIGLEELAAEFRTYHEFVWSKHVGPLPRGLVDITSLVVAERYPGRVGVEYIVGQDFGNICNTSEILKCYSAGSLKLEDRRWYAVDEVITYSTTAEQHARKLREHGYTPIKSVVIADPHDNRKNTETHITDYRQFEKVGYEVHRAGKPPIIVRHRVSMMNALLLGADKVTRFGILTDSTDVHPKCPVLARALKDMVVSGSDLEPRDKGPNDLTHAPCAAGYGVFPFERIRGGGPVALDDKRVA